MLIAGAKGERPAKSSKEDSERPRPAQDSGSEVEVTQAALKASVMEPATVNDQPVVKVDALTITPSSRWEEVQESLQGSLSHPVAFNREPNTNATNPFGATLFWNYDDFIFEVRVFRTILSAT